MTVTAAASRARFLRLTREEHPEPERAQSAPSSDDFFQRDGGGGSPGRDLFRNESAAAAIKKHSERDPDQVRNVSTQIAKGAGMIPDEERRENHEQG